MQPRHGARARRGSTWSEYRARAWTLRLALASGVVLAIAFLEVRALSALDAKQVAAACLAWAALVAWAGTRLQRFECPRCANRYFKRRPWLLALRSRRCAHCVLPRDV